MTDNGTAIVRLPPIASPRWAAELTPPLAPPCAVQQRRDPAHQLPRQVCERRPGQRPLHRAQARQGCVRYHGECLLTSDQPLPLCKHMSLTLAPTCRVTDLHPRQHCAAGPHDPRAFGDGRDPLLRRPAAVCRPRRAPDGRRAQAFRVAGPQLPPRAGAHLPAPGAGLCAALHGPGHDGGVQREPGRARGGRLFAPRRRAREFVGAQVAVDHHGEQRHRGVPPRVRRTRLLARWRARVALRRLPPAGHLVRFLPLRCRTLQAARTRG